MPPTEGKTLVQCDFDSTIATDDVSFMLLDAFADGDWRQLLKEYREDRIPVGVFNAKSFAMVKADKQTLLDFILVQNKIRIRPGFNELLTYCAKKGFKFVIVSNGLSFYIEAILKDIGVDNIEVFASQTEFNAEGLRVKYIGPDGSELVSGFKDAYTKLFLSRGYRVVYIGDGKSDRSPAGLADYVFARDDLLAHCREKNIDCTPFNDLNDVVKGLELLS
ncbi:MAG: MtnX-like HAD-IB family phosphatase [Dehalococcoidales bacterium]